jgi:hypothetical protein
LSIINLASDGIPSAFVVLWRALIEFGPTPRKRLLELCAPEAVGDPKQARQTLSTWIALGAFEENEHSGEVKLAKAFAAKDIDDIEWLRDRTFKCLLSQAGENAAPEFAAAAAWLLLQDPFKFPSSGEEIVPFAINQGFKGFSNPGRWTGFITWARFVGVVVPAKTIVINPVHLVRNALKRASLPAATKVPVEDFLSALSQEIPIIPGGARSKKVAASLVAPPLELADHEVAPTLSLALRQLHYERTIDLQELSDSKVRLQLLGRDRRPLEHVTHVMLEAAQ